MVYFDRICNRLRSFEPQSHSGMKYGLKMLLDAENYDYASPINHQEGFMISVLHHLDMPIMKNTGIYISAGFSNNLGRSYLKCSLLNFAK